jgi:tryptophan synthase beta chain
MIPIILLVQWWVPILTPIWCRFQSVISEEIRWQLKEKTGSELPAKVIACVGGGSNAAGAFYHFLDEPSVQLIAVEAAGWT